MNKGISLSNGEILNFMNSGDFFYNNRILELISNEFIKDEKIGILYGLTECFSDSIGIRYTTGGRINQSKLWKEIPLCHQSMFFKKDVFNILGVYDTNFKIVADYEFLLRFINKCYDHGFKEFFINIPVSKFNLYGFNAKNYISTLKEIKQVSRKYYDINLFKNLYFSLKMVKGFLLTLLIKLKLLRFYRKVKYNYLYKSLKCCNKII